MGTNWGCGTGVSMIAVCAVVRFGMLRAGARIGRYDSGGDEKDSSVELEGFW